MKLTVITACLLAIIGSLIATTTVDAGNACSSLPCIGGDSLTWPPTNAIVRDLETDTLDLYLDGQSKRRGYSEKEKQFLRRQINEMKRRDFQKRVDKRLEKEMKRRERKDRLKRLFGSKKQSGFSEDELLAMTMTRL